uniref:Uncharacterized protein n=1 Tax=Parascaris equorum TaxID=6256 RepID=A0A914S8T7_PAREQ
MIHQKAVAYVWVNDGGERMSYHRHRCVTHIRHLDIRFVQNYLIVSLLNRRLILLFVATMMIVISRNDSTI